MCCHFFFGTKCRALQIFEHPEDLPTFNSNAIEANLRNIPGIAPCFLYMNDDMFLGAPIQPSHFSDNHGNLRLQMSSFQAPNFERMEQNLWHASVGNTNAMINRFYYPDEDPYSIKHQYVQHACYFMRTDVSHHHCCSHKNEKACQSQFAG